MLRYAMLAMLLVSLIGCHQKSPYPGFTKVSEVGSESYFVDESSSRRGPSPGLIITNQLIQHADKTYSLGPLQVNCNNHKDFLVESSTYAPDGKLLSSATWSSQDRREVNDFVCARLTQLPLFSGDFKMKAAISGVLGGDGTKWNPVIPSKWQGFLSENVGEAFLARAILDKEYVERGKTKHLVVVSSVPANGDYGCHNCGVLVSAFVIRKEALGWFIDSEEPYVGESGSFGSPPQARLFQLGPETSGFVLESGHMSQGHGGVSSSFYGSVGNKIVDLVDIFIEQSDVGFGNGKYAESNTTYKFGPEVSNGFYDIHLTTKGTKFGDTNDSIVVSADRQSTCRMDGSAYKCS